MRNLILLTLGFAFLLACEGPQGPPGRDGARGPQGPAGEDGDASFDYSTFIYTIEPNSWVSYDSQGFYAEVDAPEITYDILDYGYFITYMNLGTEDEPRYIELPRTLVLTDQDGVTYSKEFYPNYSINTVRIEYFDTHPDGALKPESNYLFRTVVIGDPESYSTLKSKVDISDHDAVMEELEKNGTKINNPVME